MILISHRGNIKGKNPEMENSPKYIKKALDLSSLLNPGKVYPILRKCAEEGRVHVHKGKTKFPGIPRF
mgnify:CR=1 FL=1